MQLVLAVEPDRTQADTLRRIVDQLADVQLVLVTSAYAAVVMINRRVPDVVLVGPSLGPKATEEVLDHFHLASDTPDAQTLAIPLFRDSKDASQDRGLFRRGPRPQTVSAADPDAFRAEIAVCLTRAEQQRRDAPAPKLTVLPFQAKASEEAPSALLEPLSVPELRAEAVVEAVAAHEEVIVAHEEAAGPLEAPVAPDNDEEISLDIDSTPSVDAPIDAEVHFAELAVAHARAEARLAEELDRVRNEAAEQRTAELARMQAEADAQRLTEVAAAREAAVADTRTALSEELTSVREEAERALAAELARVRSEAAQGLAEQLQQAEALRLAEVEDARRHAEQSAAVALESEIGRIRQETDAQLAAELQRVHAEAEDARRAQEQALLEAKTVCDTVATDARRAEEAAALALEGEVTRLRRQSEARLEAELARVRQEAADAHLAQQQTRADADAVREAAVREAAGREARAAADAEVARIRADTEARLAAELSRVHEEAERARRAHEQALNDAKAARDSVTHDARIAEEAVAQGVAAEVARVRRESEVRLAAELSRARHEADEARRAQQQAQTAAEMARKAAVREGREAAEIEAARALEAAVSRARREADRRLERELERVRADAEFAQLALHQAQIEAVAARDAAAREARAAAEADAALVHEEELTRVRIAAEARLRAELDRARQESDGERRSARTRAEAMLEAEVARARADADARLAAEVAQVRADADRRRAAELAEVRAQLKDAFESARDDARSAASLTVSSEVARAETTIAKTAAALAATAGKQAAVVALRASVVTLKWVGKGGRAAAPVIWEFVRDLPPRVLATAATVLLVAGCVAVVGVASLTRPVGPLARSASNTAARLFGAANQAVQSFESAKRTEVPAIPVVNRTSPRPKPMKEIKPLATGWLAVFSRVPLDLYVSGRRIGSTNDDGHIVLAAGHYKVELVSKEFNYQGEVVLDIRAGEVTSHNFTLPTGLLQVETEPGSEIWVEGERAGVAPLGPVPMPIGTRDVVVKHPDRGERRSAVTVRYNEITTLRLSLGEMIRPQEDAFPLPPQARVGPLTP